jgi:hypothetical protein
LQHSDWVTHATFSPDGQWVLTTSADKSARLWQVPTASSSPPAWLAGLAEAIAGQRLDQDGVPHPVPLDRLLELRRQLTTTAGQDPYSRWAGWFFADRRLRPLTALSPSPPSPARSSNPLARGLPADSGE